MRQEGFARGVHQRREQPRSRLQLVVPGFGAHVPVAVHDETGRVVPRRGAVRELAVDRSLLVPAEVHRVHHPVALEPVVPPVPEPDIRLVCARAPLLVVLAAELGVRADVRELAIREAGGQTPGHAHLLRRVRERRVDPDEPLEHLGEAAARGHGLERVVFVRKRPAGLDHRGELLGEGLEVPRQERGGVFAEIRIRQPRARHAVGVHVHTGLVARVPRVDDVVVVRGVRLHEHRGRPPGGHGHRHRGARCFARNQSPRQSRGCARAARARAAGARGRAGHRARARVRRARLRRHRHPTPIPPPCVDCAGEFGARGTATSRRLGAALEISCDHYTPSVAIRRDEEQIFMISLARSTSRDRVSDCLLSARDERAIGASSTLHSVTRFRKCSQAPRCFLTAGKK